LPEKDPQQEVEEKRRGRETRGRGGRGDPLFISSKRENNVFHSQNKDLL
jgi:hypothetical protein